MKKQKAQTETEKYYAAKNARREWWKKFRISACWATAMLALGVLAVVIIAGGINGAIAVVESVERSRASDVKILNLSRKLWEAENLLHETRRQLVMLQDHVAFPQKQAGELVDTNRIDFSVIYFSE